MTTTKYLCFHQKLRNVEPLPCSLFQIHCSQEIFQKTRKKRNLNNHKISQIRPTYNGQVLVYITKNGMFSLSVVIFIGIIIINLIQNQSANCKVDAVYSQHPLFSKVYQMKVTQIRENTQDPYSRVNIILITQIEQNSLCQIAQQNSIQKILY